MKPFRDLGIQNKLHLMTLVICSAVLLVATLALFSFQVWNFRANFKQATMTMANIIANNSTAAVEFKEDLGAGEVLKALKSDPAVISASLVLPDGSVLAHYGKVEDKQSLSQFPGHRQAEFSGGQLLVSQPILFTGDWVGTLYLRSDYQSTFLQLLKFYGLLTAMVIIISFCLGVLLSGRLSRTITGPVLELARTAKIVGEEKDYSVRVAGDRRGDELGSLMHSFNEMLERIERQDEALSLSEEKMKALIHSIDGIVWERRPDNFNFTFISRQSETMLGGYPPEAWLEHPHFWDDKLHPQDAVKAITTGHDLARKGQSYDYEYRMIAADGRTVWIRESGTVLVENGAPIALRGIMQDITRQKKDSEQLDKLNRQLQDASRQAGMADVATGVLHNVGNVLNSVSVAATVVGERLQRSKIVGLQRATTLIREQNGQPGEYLTNDPKGKLLPIYIDTLASQLAEERDELLTKVQSVAQNIEHIKEIVAMQQSYAKVSGAYENLMASDLIEDALRINIAAFDRHNIRVVREFAQVPPVCVDRHKVLQILINLLRNAKHAMEGMETDRKELVIRIGNCAPNQISVVIRDNGLGIPPANLTKIFNHGFTTKKDGHGFGLHSGANAAKEMGGSLAAHSDGPGKGAEFTLKLPVAVTRKEEPVKTKL